MSNTLPKSQAILNYQDFFGMEPPADPLDLLKSMDKTIILGEFAGLNYRLKPKTTMYYDTTLKTQQRELFYFSGKNPDLLKKYYPLYAKHINSEKDYPLLFTRATCLYAAEQIINSNIAEVPGFTMVHSWPKLFQYLLVVNTEITRQTTKRRSDEPASLEELNPRMIPLNELGINVNPLYTPYRGYKLLEYFSAHPYLGKFFREYFQLTYEIPFDHFIYELLSIAYGNNKDGVNDIVDPQTGERLDTSFYYSVPLVHQTLFNSLSLLYKNYKIERFISVKKSPFYKAPNNHYLLLDSILLLDKAYNQFINDFWFDCIKSVKGADGKPAFPTRYYRGEVGRFVENYTNTIFRYSFANAKYYTLRTFDELKTKTGGEEKELTDIYLRYNRKVFVAETKATGLYDEEKYSGDINDLYKKDRNKFFQSFGINQIVNCIDLLKKRIQNIDPSFPSDHRCQIFPAIIVNEKAMQTPLMAHIFNTRFGELMKDVKLDNLTVHALSLIHISDLEHMEDLLHLDPARFWKILRYHLRFPTFIPPFYNTLNRLDIKPNFKKTVKLFEELILKFEGRRASNPPAQ